MVPRGEERQYFNPLHKMTTILPLGNTYYIENIADREAKLVFTQARKLAPNEEEIQHLQMVNNRRSIEFGIQWSVHPRSPATTCADLYDRLTFAHFHFISTIEETVGHLTRLCG